jgi:hypothetical protein
MFPIQNLTCFIRYGKLPPQLNSPNTATLIQRGGGTGPLKPRQPSFFIKNQGANSGSEISGR